MKLKKSVKKYLALMLAVIMSFSFSAVTAFADLGTKDTKAAAAQNGRTEISFNNDWRFKKGNVAEAETAAFDDSEWLYVNVPHSTVMYTPENYYQKDLGVFWYRRTFETPEVVDEGKEVLLTFGAAMQQADVWLNDVKLGTHQGGYTEFSFDVTDYLKTDGSNNVLAVKIDTRPSSSFTPGKSNPDFQYFGGLYRNVVLTVKEAVHITDAVTSGTVGGGGVFLLAPEVTKESAVVKAKTEVKNSKAEAAEVTVLTEILDTDGSVAAQASDTYTVASEEKYTFIQNLVVDAPRLWSVNTPELYNVRTTVITDGEVCDMEETVYGIRKIEWKRDGCYINDERVELVGTNLHSEIYMLGNAVSDDAIFEEVKRIRENGFNFIRMAHYQHADAYYAACDKYGVAVLDCLAGWQNFSNTTAFKENCYQQMREMVRANRNHPSIVAWEPSLNESSFDSSWATTINSITKAEYPDDGAAKAYTCGWRQWNVYDFGVGTPQANVVGDAAKYSNKAVIVSEYGDWNMGGYNSTTRVTREPQHYSSAKGGDEGMLIQCDNVQSSFAYNRSKTEWYGATAYWQYADYAGFDTEKLTYCGVVDVARIPKFSAYFFQSQTDPSLDLSKYGIKSGPMVFIANTWASDSPDQVRIFSNCDEIELYLDDQLIGRQSPDTTMWDPRGKYSDSDYGKQVSSSSGATVSTENLEHPPFTFDLSAYTPGQGTLRAVGYINGEQKTQYIRRAPGSASQITLQAENTAPLKLDGSTAKLVWVDVKDANGTVVNTANNAITFKTEGPGFVIGEKTVAVRGGQWAVWVRSTRGEGDITLTASANGLTGTSIVIPTETVEGLPEVPEGGDADESTFVEVVEPDNIFINKPASASSENKGKNGMELASYANDGSDTSKWCAKVTDSSDSSLAGQYWWQVDLGASYRVDTVEILFEQAAGYKYQVAVSDDPEFADYKIEDHVIKTEEGGTAVEIVGEIGRYVRIYLNCAGSRAWPCLFEVRGTGARAIDVAENLALNKPATAIGSKSGSNPGMAVDGSADAFWNRGGNGPGWWQVDLEDIYHVDEAAVSFAWAGTSDNGIIRHKFTLQGSVDGEIWTDIAQWSDLDQTDDIVNARVILPVDANVRYLKVNDLEAKKQDGGATQWIEIAEFVAVGKKAAELVRMDYNAETSATSNAEGVTPEFGNDGNPQTFWIPSADDTNPSWQFDSDAVYDTRTVELTWNTEGEHAYKIELSTDGATWKTAADHMDAPVSGSVTLDTVSGQARYVRISVPAGTTDGFWINCRGLYVSAVPTVTPVPEPTPTPDPTPTPEPTPEVTPIPADENLFLNKEVTASSENTNHKNVTEYASYANDGDESTKWCASASGSDDYIGNHWWQVDLGESYQVDMVEIVFESSAGYQYQVAVSDDPEFTGYDVDAHVTKRETTGVAYEAVEAEGRYVRVYCNCPSSSAWPCLKEVRGTGTKAEVPTVLAITKQPESTAVHKAADAAIAIEAVGDGLSYAWYYKNPGNIKFYASGTQFVSEDGTGYSIPMYAWRDGQEVYCVVTDKYGNSVQSNTVVLTMATGTIEIVKQPESVSAEKGEDAVVKVEATGDTLSYTWYYKNPGNVKFYASEEQFVSEDGASYIIPMQTWRDGQQVYCVITDANGATVQTNTVTLTMQK